MPSIAHENMVNQQVRCWDVIEPRVLEVLTKVPREHFVPSAYRSLAFADTNIPLTSSAPAGRQWTMMRPIVEGRLLQALEIAELGLHGRLEAQEAELEGLKRKVRTRLAAERASDIEGSVAELPAADEEVELELLRRRGAEATR